MNIFRSFKNSCKICCFLFYFLMFKTLFFDVEFMSLILNAKFPSQMQNLIVSYLYFQTKRIFICTRDSWFSFAGIFEVRWLNCEWLTQLKQFCVNAHFFHRNWSRTCQQLSWFSRKWWPYWSCWDAECWNASWCLWWVWHYGTHASSRK